MISQRLAMLALLLPLAACQPFQTVSEDGEHVTYRFDPTKVSDDRVVEAAEDKCEISPLGARPAVPVDIVDSGGMREMSFVCKAPGGGLNVGPTLDRALSKIPVP
jgi:hypothetical protein